MNDQVVSLLNKAKKILIIPNTQNNGDIFFASLALDGVLKQADKQVYILSERLNTSSIWKYKLKTFKNIHPISNIPVRLQLTLNQNRFNINNLSWEKKDGDFNIYLDTEKEVIDPGQIELQKIKMDFDLIIAIGTINGNSLVNLGLPEKILNKTTRLFITPSKIALNDLILLEPKQNELKSFSIRIKNIIEYAQIALTKDSATMILAGIITHTNTFKKSISLDLFDSVKALVKKGANYQSSYDLAVQDLTLKKAKLLSELLNNIEEKSEGIYFSQGNIPPGQKLKLKINEVLKLTEIYNCRMAVVAVKSGPQNLVYIKINDLKIDLKKILIQLKGKGNSTQGLIITTLPAAIIMDQILSIISGVKPISKSTKTIDKGKLEEYIPAKLNKTNTEFNPLAPAKQLPNPLKLVPNIIKESQDISPLPIAR